MVRDAHTRLLHGELIPVEITAACFDPGYQLLVTGARNGTLKVGTAIPFYYLIPLSQRPIQSFDLENKRSSLRSFLPVLEDISPATYT